MKEWQLGNQSVTEALLRMRNREGTTHFLFIFKACITSTFFQSKRMSTLNLEKQQARKSHLHNLKY